MSDSTRDLSRDHASTTPAAHDSNTKHTTRRPPPDPRKPIKHPQSKVRRDMMRALRICINGSFVVPPPPTEPGKPQPPQSRPPTITSRPIVQHGPAVRGGRCQRCLDVRAGIAPTQSVPPPPVVVYTTVKYELLRLPPLGTKRRRYVEMLVAGMTPHDIAVIDGVFRGNVHSAVRFARRMGELR